MLTTDTVAHFALDDSKWVESPIVRCRVWRRVVPDRDQGRQSRRSGEGGIGGVISSGRLELIVFQVSSYSQQLTAGFHLVLYFAFSFVYCAILFAFGCRYRPA